MQSKNTAEAVEPVSTLTAEELIAKFAGRGLAFSPQPNPTALQASLHSKEASAPLNLKQAAEYLDHSYFWLSRNYRKLGLRPSRIGGKLLFSKKEITHLLTRFRVKSRGRPIAIEQCADF